MNDIIIKEIDIKNKRFGRVAPIGDSHIGGPDFNKEFFDYVMNWIYKNKEILVVGMGDYIDLATLSSPTDPWQQTKSGNKQAKILIDYFKPLADENRLIGLLLGNHEYRLGKHANFDIVEFACDILEVPYLGVGDFFQINIKKNGNIIPYIFYASHGSSGAQTKGGKVNAMFKAAKPFKADVYLFGHTHDVSINKEDYFEVVNGKREQKEYYVVNTGHFTNYWKSYAQMKGYSVGRMGSPKIQLYGGKKRVGIHI